MKKIPTNYVHRYCNTTLTRLLLPIYIYRYRGTQRAPTHSQERIDLISYTSVMRTCFFCRETHSLCSWAYNIPILYILTSLWRECTYAPIYTRVWAWVTEYMQVSILCCVSIIGTCIGSVTHRRTLVLSMVLSNQICFFCYPLNTSAHQLTISAMARNFR